MSPAPQSAPRSSLPRATYRFQFHSGFPFAAAAELAPYLAALGISHVYSSPILAARPGSTHGYDVVDYTRINPELGGEDGFREMAAALRAQGIGIVLDIVPNHVAVGPHNAMWLDLLQHGRESRHAAWFDVDFDVADPLLRGKVLAPFLGRPYHEALAAGELVLAARDGGGFAITYGDHLFPIRPADEARIGAAGVEAFAEPERLDELLARQNFRLDSWRHAGDRINWRRFFDITDLAAIRMEEPEAFEAAHAVAFRLYAEGLVDGLRIDHIDGLADPAAYCRTLRARLDELAPERPAAAAAGRAWIVVEKILAEDETLPRDWGVDGTTGYDFMAQLSALQHEAASAETLAAHWAAVGERSPRFADEERLARHEILDRHFHAQREGVVEALADLAAGALHPEAIPRAALSRAVTLLTQNLRVYRSYATGRADLGVAGVAFEAALGAAAADPTGDGEALRFIADVVAGNIGAQDEYHRAKAVRRLNQLTAPTAAKAVEDTAFYRYGRLISRNDVGFDPALLGQDAEAFHAQMRHRAGAWPASLLATATHDHKRGEDVRARLAVLSELAGEWIAASGDWFALNDGLRPAGVDRGDEYQLYQMVVGAWPLGLRADDAAGLAAFAQRLSGWREKSLREAKLRSSWSAPDFAHEEMWQGYLETLLDPARAGAFLESAAAFVERIAAPGAANGLVQAALRCTSPGVPDIYQGTEFWDFSLVDPDNRRPVDYEARRSALAQDAALPDLLTHWRDGRIKQALVARLLRLRQDMPRVFSAGGYEPLAVEGARAGHVVAFMRREGEEAVAIVAARCIAGGLTGTERLVPERSWWQETAVTLPGLDSMRDVVTDENLAKGGTMPVADLLRDLPFAVLRLCGVR